MRSQPFWVDWRGPQSTGGSVQASTSAAIDALFVIFACFFPNQPINFLLFFVFPVTIKPKHIACFLAAVDLLVLLVYEIPGVKLPFEMTISSSAHLGGMLTGFLYYRFVHEAPWFNPLDRADVELPRWIRRAKKSSSAAAAFEVNVTPPSNAREDIRVEVDRILDKINSHGFGALTPAEKRVLDDAKHLLSRP